jgi:CPA1 family monovalent cation:H+ antiporter
LEGFLAIFVPLLIFEAAFHRETRLLRQNLVPILVLAVPGVIAATLLIGGVVSLGTGLAFSTASLFGALIAATDPLAVVQLARSLGVPRRLAVAIEGESLFNDGTAIVVFRIALTAALSDVFHPLPGVLDFLVVALGGMAVVVTGLLSGNVGLAKAAPTTKMMLFNLWDFLAFLANSLLFLLIGLSVDLTELWASLGLTERPQHRVQQERKLGCLFTARAGLSRLQRLHREGAADRRDVGRSAGGLP